MKDAPNDYGRRKKVKTLRTHTLKKKNLLWIKVLTFCPTNLF